MLTASLSEAQTELARWKAALAAIAEGQSYQMGKTALTRADLDRVVGMVERYQDEVNRWTRGTGAGGRVRRIIPQDL